MQVNENVLQAPNLTQKTPTKLSPTIAYNAPFSIYITYGTKTHFKAASSVNYGGNFGGICGQDRGC